ncbi:MAG: hypothetical protein N0C88_01315 [Candidatus Thiodiazotropha lotti]|uniref:Uncharacterized protein n=1 Tax=Candidatus Thiodiazotropha lotti TaxID=2792787 RepID=A0A9E4K2C1_9GAMM|nr:hypothetical protein [Candidatus Thiodiazotropha weberae]MCG7937485.1 hypothetical protein [Candidatus Thiodiazotropha lotti]MCW4201951.1 hypothetical protein [Candidatus Thiodiazotropha lotti]
MNRQTSLKPSGPWEVRRRIKLHSMGHSADALAVECAFDELPGVVKVVADAVKGRAGLMQSHRQQMFTSGPGNSDQRLNFHQQGLEQM